MCILDHEFVLYIIIYIFDLGSFIRVAIARHIYMHMRMMHVCSWLVTFSWVHSHFLYCKYYSNLSNRRARSRVSLFLDLDFNVFDREIHMHLKSFTFSELCCRIDIEYYSYCSILGRMPGLSFVCVVWPYICICAFIYWYVAANSGLSIFIFLSLIKLK